MWVTNYVSPSKFRNVRCLFIILLFAVTSGLFAQEWRVNVESGVAGFPQKDRDPRLQFGLNLGRHMYLAPRLYFSVFGGIRRLSYTNTENFVGDDLLLFVNPCVGDCRIINERIQIGRTEVNLGFSVDLQLSRLTLSTGITLGYDVMGEVVHEYFNLSAEVIRIQTNKLYEKPEISRFFPFTRSRELSRRFHPYTSLSISYAVTKRFSVRLTSQSPLGTMMLTETEYRGRQTLTPTTDTRVWELADASVNSLLFGVQYRL